MNAYKLFYDKIYLVFSWSYFFSGAFDVTIISLQ